MNKIIRELCKVTNFSNLMFVVTEADGKVVSVGNSISKSLITDIHGNIWFDYVAPEDRDRVIEEYRYIAINKKIGEEIIYSLENCPPAKWTVSFVNNNYRLIVSVGVLLNQTESDYDKVRAFYSDLIREDKAKIIEMGGFSVEEKSAICG